MTENKKERVLIVDDDRSSAIHVLANKGGVTGNMPAHVTANQPGIGVVTAAWCRADQHLNTLTLVKFGNVSKDEILKFESKNSRTSS